jgi:uncharacterized membrane protein YvbJ
MYCVYCGSKTEESYNVCPNCGAILKDNSGNDINGNSFINNANMQNNVLVEKKSGWKDNVSLISAIFGLYFCIVLFTSYKEILSEIESYQEYPAASALGCVLWQLIFATVSILCARSSMKNNPNIKNKACIIISIIIYVIVVVQFIMIMNYIG